MSPTVLNRLDHLPRRNLTVLALTGIGTLVGGFHNVTHAKELIAEVIGSEDPELLSQIRDRADELSKARHEGYGRALSLYEAVNRSQHATGGLRFLANVTAGLPLVKRLSALVPSADTLQAVDLGLKVAAEMLAFTLVNGLPGDSFAAFGASLKEYGQDARVRMAALLCFDALLPLGDQALERLDGLLGSARPEELHQLPAYPLMARLIPGEGDEAHMTFVRRAVGEWDGWAREFVGDAGLTAQKAVQALEKTIGPWQGSFEQLAVFLDAFTDSYYHTGVQVVARRLVERAAAEI